MFSQIWELYREYAVIILGGFLIIRSFYLENKTNTKSISILNTIKMLIVTLLAIVATNFLVDFFNEEWDIFREGSIMLVVFFLGRNLYLEKTFTDIKISRIVRGSIIAFAIISAITITILSY